MNGSTKGSAYERDFCSRLSLWWSDGERDDLFWRSQSSGARATTRKSAGKETIGQYGDVAATSPESEKLIDLLTIELKRGYNKHTIHDILDRPTTSKQQQWEKFFGQAITAHMAAGSLAWFLVSKRDRRNEWCYFPSFLMKCLHDVGGFRGCVIPMIRMNVLIRGTQNPSVDIVGMPTELFFDNVSPKHAKLLE